jgi:FAD-dependent halogenase
MPAVMQSLRREVITYSIGRSFSSQNARRYRRGMRAESVEDADIVIAGGGPGGSTLAALLAIQGHRVVILEKESFPRHQIGESLLPSTVQGICRLTGVFDKLEEAGFTRKRGGTYLWGSKPNPWTFAFSVSPNMASSASYAYQVERSKFDKILLDHALSLGADAREKSTVIDVVQDDERVCGLYYLSADNAVRQIRAKYVVDASGNQSRIYKQVGGSRKYSEFFRSIALYGYFEGGRRLPAPNSGNILSAAFGDGWFWYIPLSEDLTSVGAVVRREMAEKVQGDPERAFYALIDSCPIIRDYLQDAKRITVGDYGRLRTRKDYSYHNTQFWRPGMALIGDAACFVDPVFSTGVHLATYSALLAARSINTVMAGMMDEQIAFQEFERRYRREYSVFYEYLMCFYDMHVDQNSYFWSAKKITKSTSPELEAFVDLVGGISSGEAALARAETLARRTKSRSEEYDRAVDQLIANHEQSMIPLFESTLVSQATVEGAQIQSRALRGPGIGRELPLFADGLIPSADGMFWSAPVQ